MASYITENTHTLKKKMQNISQAEYGKGFESIIMDFHLIDDMKKEHHYQNF